jgi:hypothetical protein
MDVHITTTQGAATHTIDLEPEPTASEAVGGVWRSLDKQDADRGGVERRPPRVGFVQPSSRHRRQRSARVEAPRVGTARLWRRARTDGALANPWVGRAGRRFDDRELAREILSAL